MMALCGLDQSCEKEVNLFGVDFVDLLLGEPDSIDIEFSVSEMSRGLGKVTCIRTDTHKLIKVSDGGGNEKKLLFDLASDPSETVDLAEVDIKLAHQLDAKLDSILTASMEGAEIPNSVYMDEATKEKLKALGYIW